jgi:uncharacterized protein YyaL (SSP411 family)
VSPNRLATATSPYLLQHADNPVDWYPWGEEALARARELDRPIFLSIGYAACHWCHVMERESFEDEETAALLNEHFVPIKVDREERPDLDAIYMDAVQALAGHGGWPMSVFCTPDGRPFYAGTYFPKEPRYGMPSFRQVLVGIADAWRERRERVELQGDRVTEAIARASRLPRGADVDDAVLRAAFDALRGAFDARFGGFGGAPKFPQPMTLEFCLRMAVRGFGDAEDIVVATLEHMADGGIYDQVGGGFARYATDEAWHVPHFEKMLPDNAQLAALYLRAWQHTGRERFREVAVATLEYLLRELRGPEGGFWSSQDADSEGVEGRFYVWGWDELVGIVGEEVAIALGASPTGNWEQTNVLWRPAPVAAVAAELGVDDRELARRIEEARRVLFEHRERRVRPATDDKVLAGWNGLAIRALAEAGRALGEAPYLEAAERCARFVWDHLRDERGRLLRAWRNGVASVPAFAEDHGLVASAFLTLYEATGDPTWVERARGLAEDLLRRFRDEERGGFFQTGSDAEPLLVRPKDVQDNALPSGNAAAAEALARLALLTGEDRYEAAAREALGLVRELLVRAPTGFAHALCVADLLVGPAREVAIVGDPADPATRALVDEVVARRWRPNVVLARAAPDDVERAAEVVPLLRGRTALGGRPTAYVCVRFACRAPVTTPEALARDLDDTTAG